MKTKTRHQRGDLFASPSGSANGKLSVECSTCLGIIFERDIKDFICLHCGSIIDGPWPDLAADPSHSPINTLSDTTA
jgi:ribosomal protein S27E